MRGEELRRQQMPLRVLAYVVLVGLVAAVAGAVTATSNSLGSARAPWGYCLMLLALLVLSNHLQIRYIYHGQSDGLTLFEVALTPAMFVAPAIWVLAAAVLVHVVDSLVRRNNLIKSLFNVCQWCAAVSAGLLVLGFLRDGSDGSARNLTALVAAVLAVMITNQVLLSGVLYLATGNPFGAPGRTKPALFGRTLSALISVSMGSLLSAAFVWQPATIVFAFVPLLALHWASRGWAAARADRIRLSGLHEATHALTVPLDPREAFADFLSLVRERFEHRAVDLVLFESSRATVHRCDETGYRTWVTSTDSHRLAARAMTVAGAQRLSLATDRADAADLTTDGWRDCLITPLRSRGSTRGALITYDRTGLEGFEEGELAVLEALASELTGALEKAELVTSLLEERRRLTEIVERTSDGIFTLDAAGTITSWNPALEGMTGYTADGLVGTAHLGTLRPRGERGEDLFLEQWPRTATLPSRMQVTTASGETRWLSCSFNTAPGADGAAETLIVVARDITAQHELEKLKDDFVAVVSHELRTPLAPIKGWATTLLARGDQMSQDQQRAAITSILRQSQRLEQMVLNILEVARIEGGADRTGGELVNVTEIVGKVVDELSATAPDRAIRVHGTGEPVEALGETLWIERVLSNLLQNALKYAPTTEPVDVSLRVEGAEVALSVTDRGPGIPAGMEDRIFGRFERLHDTSAQTGTGLGLYISRQLAHAMGATLRVESTPGVGATFTLALRAAAVRVPEPTSQAIPTPR